MPVRKVGTRYQWGAHGKLYSVRSDAVKQGKAVVISQQFRDVTQSLSQWHDLDRRLQNAENSYQRETLRRRRDSIGMGLLRRMGKG